jgi:hypothetical protein
MVVAASCYGYACHREFFRIKINRIELSTDKILENFQQTLGDKFTFQQDNNLKCRAKYT